MADRDMAAAERLKTKLLDAARCGDQERMLKILHRLHSLPMTLDILQHTHIGKEVNTLRKIEGEVGKMAKQLVKAWKQLISVPSNHDTPPSIHSTTPSSHAPHTARRSEERSQGSTREEERGGEGEGEERVGGRERNKEELGGRERRGRERRGRGGGGELIKSNREEGRREKGYRDKQRKRETNMPGHSTMSGGAGSSRVHSTGREREAVDNLSGAEELTSQPYSYTPSSSSKATPTSSLHASFVEGVGVASSQSPSTSPAQRKRGAPLLNTADAVALTKRSRTAVYSGKKAQAGPQVVPSLFDLSMRVLIDNIDAIEEVGGVPYLILEPLLQKCTVTQLLRLEELNPHFLEDSDVLWERHCQKDFRGFRPSQTQSWRELYLVKLGEREERLKNITANIRKREEARKEPVRQVKLAIATRAPGRRRQHNMPLPSRSSLITSRGNRGTEHSATGNGSKLRKQTMKMVKERSMIIMSRPSTSHR